MEQINAVIDKLRSSGANGCYFVLQALIERYQKKIDERNSLPLVEARQWLLLHTESTRMFSEIRGLIWGLYAAGFISETDKDKILEEVETLDHLD